MSRKKCIKKPIISFGFHAAGTLTATKSGHQKRCSCIFIHQPFWLGDSEGNFWSSKQLPPAATQRILHPVWLWLSMKQVSVNSKICGFCFTLMGIELSFVNLVVELCQLNQNKGKILQYVQDLKKKKNWPNFVRVMSYQHSNRPTESTIINCLIFLHWLHARHTF